ncbi:hypothetical protein ACFWOG_30190 [Kitasatospora sp. NPDC058406]|uniref:hypothetical protein n=1 Tax=Kitasatospora sp. NPDC058406 TaxID=3346483 RepID=UPI00364A6D7F
MRVPARLPYDRYPPDTTDPDSVLLHRRRWIRAGAEFEPAVTDLPEPDGEHMVAGVLVAPHSRVRVELTDDQAVELGPAPSCGSGSGRPSGRPVRRSGSGTARSAPAAGRSSRMSGGPSRSRPPPGTMTACSLAAAAAAEAAAVEEKRTSSWWRRT